MSHLRSKVKIRYTCKKMSAIKNAVSHEIARSASLMCIRRRVMEEVEKYMRHPSGPKSSPKYFTNTLALHIEVFRE
jgi:hypothetical protein